MSNTRLSKLSENALKAEHLRLEKHLRGVRRTLDFLMCTDDEDEIRDCGREVHQVVLDLGAVEDEIAARVAAGGAR